MMSPRVLDGLIQALAGLKYGAVQLVVHEGHVVRIERIERMRLPAAHAEAVEAAQAGLTGTPEADSMAGPTDRIPGGAKADHGEI